jgi:hypothetical protein
MSENTETRSNEPPRAPFSGETAETVESLLSNSVEIGFAARSLPTDTLLPVLAEPGHRYVLTYLLRSDGPVTVDEPVEYAVTSTETAADEELRGRVTAASTPVHLPRLDDAGFVGYDADDGSVATTAQTALAEPYPQVALRQSRLAERLR